MFLFYFKYLIVLYSATAPIHKVLFQQSEQERSISTAEQNSSILPLNTKMCYLGAQCKRRLSRSSLQKRSISTFNAIRFYLSVKFKTIITITKENLPKSQGDTRSRTYARE